MIFLVGVGVRRQGRNGRNERNKSFYEQESVTSNIHSNPVSVAADEITEDVEDGGAQISAGTDFDSTIFYIQGYPRYLSKNIRICLRNNQNFEYKEEEIERERRGNSYRIKKSIDSPKEHYLEHLFIPVLLRKTCAEKPILGTPKSVKRITKEEIIAFKKKFYVPENMTIFVCGKFDEERSFKNDR